MKLPIALLTLLAQGCTSPAEPTREAREQPPIGSSLQKTVDLPLPAVEVGHAGPPATAAPAPPPSIVPIEQVAEKPKPKPTPKPTPTPKPPPPPPDPCPGCGMG